MIMYSFGSMKGKLWQYAGWAKRLHTRNQHLRHHRGFPAASSQWICSVAFSNGTSLVRGIVQRI